MEISAVSRTGGGKLKLGSSCVGCSAMVGVSAIAGDSGDKEIEKWK